MHLLEYELGQSVRAFSTPRHSGGQGEGAYSSFNITPYCGDTVEHIKQCRQELCATLGIAEHLLLLPRQTHTNNLCCIDESFIQLSTQEQGISLNQRDALITNIRGICIGVSTADCLPLLLYAPDYEWIGAVHAGWRGMVGHIITRTIAALHSRGVDPKQLRAVIGPCITAPFFEVGDEVIDAFIKSGHPTEIITQGRRRLHIDLPAAAVWQLEQSGVDLLHIQVSGLDTYSSPRDWFSARRDGVHSGRIYNGILLR